MPSQKDTAVPFWVHSTSCQEPSIGGVSPFAGPLSAGADGIRARPSNRVFIPAPSGSLLRPLELHEDQVGVFGRIEPAGSLGRLLIAKGKGEADRQCIAFDLVNPRRRMASFAFRTGQVDLALLLLRIDLVGPGFGDLALPVDREFPVLLECETHSLPALRGWHFLAAHDELFPDPLADDGRFLLRRLLRPRRTQRYGKTDE